MSRTPNRNVQGQNHENFWVEGLKTIGLSLVLAFGIRTFAAQAFFIPSGSIEPTLQIKSLVRILG